MSLTSRHARTFIARTWTGFAALAAVLGTIAVIVPNWVDGRWWLLLVSAAAGLAWASFGLRPKWPNQRYCDDRISIQLVKGDLFKQGEPALVGMSSTFDTDVAGGVIGRNSVQSSFLDNVYGGDVSRLDTDLDVALATVRSIGTITKPGKTAKYPISTVVTLPSTSGIPCYCVAYCEMDVTNRAIGNIPGVLRSLETVWDSADSHGNKRPVCVPLIGQGFARINEFPAEVAVRVMAFSFLLRSRRSHFSNELRIVVHPAEVGSIDLNEFQAFLRSLVPR